MYFTGERPIERDAISRIEPPQLPTLDQLERQILATVRTASALLKQAIRVPDGHEWRVDSECFDMHGAPLAACEHGTSFFIRKTFAPGIDEADRLNDPHQLAAEIRLFLPAQQYLFDNRIRTFRKYGGRRFSAHLSVKFGPQRAERYLECLDESNREPETDTLEELIDAIAKTMNAALAGQVSEQLTPNKLPQQI
jgi:hypothetical protein